MVWLYPGLSGFDVDSVRRDGTSSILYDLMMVVSDGPDIHANNCTYELLLHSCCEYGDMCSARDRPKPLFLVSAVAETGAVSEVQLWP